MEPLCHFLAFHWERHCCRCRLKHATVAWSDSAECYLAQLREPPALSAAQGPSGGTWEHAACLLRALLRDDCATGWTGWVGWCSVTVTRSARDVQRACAWVRDCIDNAPNCRLLPLPGQLLWIYAPGYHSQRPSHPCRCLQSLSGLGVARLQLLLLLLLPSRAGCLPMQLLCTKCCRDVWGCDPLRPVGHASTLTGCHFREELCVVDVKGDWHSMMLAGGP
jgi:hypothetical protein